MAPGKLRAINREVGYVVDEVPGVRGERFSSCGRMPFMRASDEEATAAFRVRHSACIRICCVRDHARSQVLQPVFVGESTYANA